MKHFQTLQTEITDSFHPSVIRLCEIKIDSNIEQLYNLAAYNLIMNNNQLNKGGLALYIKINIPLTIKPEQTFILNELQWNLQFLPLIHVLKLTLWVTLTLTCWITIFHHQSKIYQSNDIKKNLTNH